MVRPEQSRTTTSDVPQLACVGLGSNLGDRAATIRRAIEELSGLPRSRLVASSSLHETASVGGVPQGPYLNAAALIETSLSPRELLGQLLRIERAAGRDRAKEQRWGPRTLDLDLILFAARIISEPDLKVPHPLMHERMFVLEPLAEIAPRAVHPVLNRTVIELRDAFSA